MFLLAFLLLSRGATSALAHGDIPSHRVPWPIPAFMKTSDEYWLLRPSNFTISVLPSALDPGTRCPLVDAAAVRYQSVLNRAECLRIPPETVEAYRKKSAGYISRLVVTLLGACESFPEPLMDEHYILRITSSPKKNVLLANSPWGLLRGLETFSQLVYGLSNELFAINSTYIRDYPRFPHRGLRIDTSHHFLSLRAIKKTLDAMVMNKMNVLLWKMVGNDSFPLRMTSLLELSSRGAYRTGSHEYRAEDIAHVIEYGRVRGVRIVPEVHSLDNMASVGRSHPELLCGKSGFLDPTHKDALSLVRVLYTELARLFPDQLVHVGGQEFSSSCWSNDSALMKRVEESRGSVKAFATLFFDSLFQIPYRLRKAAVVSDQIIERWNVTVPRIVLVEVPSSRLAERMGPVTAAGHRSLAFCDGLLEHNWTRLYACDPHGFEGTQTQKRRVLGGGTGPTGQYIDGTNLISSTWPWASAVAEALWSPKKQTDLLGVEGRLAQMRCLMLKRRFAAQPVGPGYCPCDVLF
ncbi:beta-hexosaminidase subunit beta-like [Dermacentor albipictus]|uniref:beta-hexosaminidase subunit beta-like n=1 Tax=Dermacentor albipictus TaxID=60249 RepID=UPI0031FC2C4C